MRSNAARAFALLFFLSGATGLVYELLWVRVLYQAFGSTLQSVTTVVAAYMGGLGLGAWLFGRRADRHPRPGALYGLLELGIGAFGALSPLALALVHRLYIGLASGLDLSAGASVALRFGLAALVLLVPTTLMGGTLPVLTRAFTGTDRDQLQRSLGLLYGLNTLGAVVGTGLAGLYLIEHVGIRASLWATAALNVLLGAGALLLARPLAPQPSMVSSPPGAEEPSATGTLRRVALVLLAATAFASLLDEIAWTRVLVLIVGGSTYAFTLVLLVFLLGIGIGSRIVARGRLAPTRTAAYAALAQAVTAAGSSLLFVVFGALPRFIIEIFQMPTLAATGRLLAMGAVVGGVVLVPAIGMGMTFPLLTELVAPPGVARSADVGLAYALNTLGSIVGAVLTGFVLVVTLGTDVTLRLGVGINVVAALTLAWLAARGVPEGSPEHTVLRFRVLAAGGLATVAFVTAAAAPRWSTRLIDLGPSIYAREPMDARMVSEFLKHRGTRQLMYTEGWNATVSVWEGVTGRTLKVNGKADASDYGDMDTQIMLAVAPVVAHPDARTAFVIGYGSGVTARVLSDIPGMQRVRVAEIEPAVLEAGRYFLDVNDNAAARPNVSIVVDDARSALQLDTARYDVIVSEPSNPWLAGVATLYTSDFFQVARTRLAEGGVFCQWVQLYQLPLSVVTGIVRNVRTVFPHVHVWFGAPADMIVLGSTRPLRYDRMWLSRLVGPGGVLATPGREYLGVDQPEDYFGHWLLGDTGVAQLLERPGIVHQDDRPALEFVAARRFIDGRGAAGVFDSLASIRAATQVQDSLSPVLFARALSVRRGDPLSYPYVERLHRTRPEPEWAVYTAAVLVGAGDTTFADSALTQLRVPRRNPYAWLLSGVVAVRRHQDSTARTLLAGALAAGADTAPTGAALAVLDTRAQHWAPAAAELRAVFATARATLRHPYPRDLISDALTTFVLSGPPATADSLLSIAVVRHAGWYKLHEFRGVAALRAGHCDTAADEFILLVDFGIELLDAPQWVERCRAGLRR